MADGGLDWDRIANLLQAGAAVAATLFAWLAVKDGRRLEQERREANRPFFSIKNTEYRRPQAAVHFVNSGNSLARRIMYKSCWLRAETNEILSVHEHDPSSEIPAGADFTVITQHPLDFHGRFLFVMACKYDDGLSDRTFSQVLYMKPGRPRADYAELGWATREEATAAEVVLRAELAAYL